MTHSTLIITHTHYFIDPMQNVWEMIPCTVFGYIRQKTRSTQEKVLALCFMSVRCVMFDLFVNMPKFILFCIINYFQFMFKSLFNTFDINICVAYLSCQMFTFVLFFLARNITECNVYKITNKQEIAKYNYFSDLKIISFDKTKFTTTVKWQLLMSYVLKCDIRTFKNPLKESRSTTSKWNDRLTMRNSLEN